MEKKYHIKKPDMLAVNNIRRALNCTVATATLIAGRNIKSGEDAVRYINPSLNNITSPDVLKDMDVAVKRIYEAVKCGEKILIFGDYDVDGITSTILLYDFFSYVKADVSHYIPHRTREGYSLQPNHITEYAVPENIDLIITVDCGSGSHEAVCLAKKQGIDVIVTDHHRVSSDIPDAVAMINPKQQDCFSGLDDLAGVGVAFYLLIGLRKYLREIGYWGDLAEPNLIKYCDLVALGTVADIVPLVNENRVFVKIGLGVLSSGERVGIKALADVSRINKTEFDSEDIAFRLAPRLNAAGRIGHANTAVDLILEKDETKAGLLAEKLNEMNNTRQYVEKEIISELDLIMKNNPQILKKKSLVFANEAWHEGVLGIVAARMVRKYYRPVILISTRNGTGKGSGRSIKGFDMFSGLSGCADSLEDFGGHFMAAGLKIKAENISKFQDDFEQIVGEMTTADDFTETVLVDLELDFAEIYDLFLDELEKMQPFGQSNIAPLFISKNVSVVSSAIIAKKHRRMLLSQFDSPSAKPVKRKNVNAIHFNVDSVSISDYYPRIAYRLQWNRWNGKKTCQIVVEDA